MQFNSAVRQLTNLWIRQPELPRQDPGVADRSHPVRPDLTVFNAVRLQFSLKGVTDEQGSQLIELFKGR